MKLTFTKEGRLTGGSIDYFLLEKTRLVYHAQGERNFHALYQVTPTPSPHPAHPTPPHSAPPRPTPPHPTPTHPAPAALRSAAWWGARWTRSASPTYAATA